MRDDEGRKECGMCLLWLAPEDYSPSKVYPDGRVPYCATCVTAARYGLSREKLSAMREESRGNCALCHLPNPGGRQLSVNHDHNCCKGSRSCGVCVRGLLCVSCNSGLGYFKDDVEALRRALAYLETWKAAGLRDAPMEPPWSEKGSRWSKFRLSTASHEQMLDHQGGRCAVCRVTPDGKSLTVDHDHGCCSGRTSCGRCVRGLLDNKCNSGLGMFKDSPELLRTAIAYLEKYAR